MQIKKNYTLENFVEQLFMIKLKQIVIKSRWDILIISQ